MKEVVVLFIIIFFSVLLVGFLLPGCSEKITSSRELDCSAIMSLIDSNPDVFSSQVIDTTMPDTTHVTGTVWWRKYRSEPKRSVDIKIESHLVPHFADALVTITDTLYITFYLVHKDSLVVWYSSRSFIDVAKRTAFFERWGSTNQPHRGWELIGVSGLLVYSASGNPYIQEIDSVHVVSSKSGYDTTITESYMTESNLLWNLFTFNLEDSVNLTVYTVDKTDSLYLHAYSPFFPLLKYVRSGFTNNGDGSFTNTWVTESSISDTTAYRHATIDAIKDSWFEGSGCGDSKIWGIIYRIKQQ
jgi:hypothetical protein